MQFLLEILKTKLKNYFVANGLWILCFSRRKTSGGASGRALRAVDQTIETNESTMVVWKLCRVLVSRVSSGKNLIRPISTSPGIGNDRSATKSTHFGFETVTEEEKDERGIWSLDCFEWLRNEIRAHLSSNDIFLHFQSAYRKFHFTKIVQLPLNDYITQLFVARSLHCYF